MQTPKSPSSTSSLDTCLKTTSFSSASSGLGNPCSLAGEWEAVIPNSPKSDSCNLNYRRIWPCVPPSLHGSPAAVASDVVLFPTGTSWRSVGQCPSCCPSPGMSFLRIMAPCPWQEGCNQVFCQVPSNPKRSMIPCGKKRMENRAGEGNLRLPLAPRQDQPHLCRFNSSYKEKLIQFYEHVHN